MEEESELFQEGSLQMFTPIYTTADSQVHTNGYEDFGPMLDPLG